MQNHGEYGGKPGPGAVSSVRLSVLINYSIDLLSSELATLIAYACAGSYERSNPPTLIADSIPPTQLYPFTNT